MRYIAVSAVVKVLRRRQVGPRPRLTSNACKRLKFGFGEGHLHMKQAAGYPVSRPVAGPPKVTLCLWRRKQDRFCCISDSGAAPGFEVSCPGVFANGALIWISKVRAGDGIIIVGVVAAATGVGAVECRSPEKQLSTARVPPADPPMAESLPIDTAAAAKVEASAVWTDKGKGSGERGGEGKKRGEKGRRGEGEKGKGRKGKTRAGENGKGTPPKNRARPQNVYLLNLPDPAHSAQNSAPAPGAGAEERKLICYVVLTVCRVVMSACRVVLAVCHVVLSVCRFVL